MRWKWIEMGQCLWFFHMERAINISLTFSYAATLLARLSNLFQRETWQGLDPEQVEYKGLPYNILVLVI